ncbi:MAG: leucine--tRNA ligase, partial [Gemmataceae bacterium]
NHPVVRRPLKQWLMRITAYAERLIDDLEPLDWSESIKQMQRNWIGRSEGAIVQFRISDCGLRISESFEVDQLQDESGQGTEILTSQGSHQSEIRNPKSEIQVFTTRPDTLFGATYMVLAPEHSLVEQITTAEQKQAVAEYQAQAARKSDFDRTELSKTKTGVFTGAFAKNPVNGKEIPIWIADYVLASYGTGAIMAVPGHDERDYEFAKQFGLPIITVVQRAGSVSDGQSQTLTADDSGTLFTDPGIAINSDFLNGLPTDQAKSVMIQWLEKNRVGSKKVNYKLRDWLFSRQRYWGEPFPLLHELDEAGQPTGVIRPLPESELPLQLPDLADYKPTGSPEGPLVKATEWMNVTIDGKAYRRETNTMPQWAGSCWYYLRFIDAKNTAALADPSKLKHWLPVDLYIGGAEHAVLHLLYSRFWHKVLFDRGILHCPEPFHKLVNQGMILGENNEKMSKARGNVVNPDDVVAEYGADALRLYEMFMGPLEAVKPWSTKGVEGVYRFLGRVWRLVVEDAAETITKSRHLVDSTPIAETLRELHRTIQKVTEDTAALRFNTAISAMMEYVNHLTKLEARPIAAIEPFLLLLAPYAPHLAEELWALLGHPLTLAYEPWPKYDPALLVADQLEIPVQVNGKLRALLTVPAAMDDAALEAAALADPKIVEFLAGKPIKKVIVKSKKMVSLVV